LAEFIIRLYEDSGGAVLLIMVEGVVIPEHDIHEYFLFRLFPFEVEEDLNQPFD
jgi:hypothetical protein